LQAVENTGARHETRTELTAEEQGDEYLMMSLRLREGASLSRFQALSGRNIPEARIAHCWTTACFGRRATALARQRVVACSSMRCCANFFNVPAPGLTA
jgi:coproporphyrinogen III oxidase-like Fe-S oxidoreductase